MTDPAKPGLLKTIDGDIHKDYNIVVGFITVKPKSSLFIGLSLLAVAFVLGHLL